MLDFDYPQVVYVLVKEDILGVHTLLLFYLAV